LKSYIEKQLLEADHDVQIPIVGTVKGIDELKNKKTRAFVAEEIYNNCVSKYDTAGKNEMKRMSKVKSYVNITNVRDIVKAALGKKGQGESKKADEFRQMISDGLKGKGDGEKLKSLYPVFNSQQDRDAIYEDYATALVALGQWDFVFVDMLHWGSNFGSRLLKRIDKEGLPVKAEILRFLKTNDFTFKFGDGAFEYMVSFMVNKEWKDAGEIITTKFIEKPAFASDAIYYVTKTKYKAALPKIVEQLASNDGRVRSQACWAIGEMGDTSHLAKLQIIADYDESYEVVTENDAKFKKYWVRAEANTAIKKIKLRS